MKKLTTSVHKFMDIEGSEMPKRLVSKFRDLELFTYRDMIMKEHLYSIDEIHDKIADDPEIFTEPEKRAIKRIVKVLDKEDCGYFRFVFN